MSVDLSVPAERSLQLSARATAPGARAVGPGLLSALAVLTALAVAAGVGLLQPRDLPGPARAYPALAVDTLRSPRLPARPAPTGSGGFAYLQVQDDGSRRPVRWDPCRPIHYVVRPDGQPPGGAAAVRAAADRISAATGLQFVAEGSTDEAPRPERAPLQVRRYGHRWAPVLVAWTDPREYPDLAGYAGLGGPDAVPGLVPGRRRYVSGVVLLNRDLLTPLSDTALGRAQIATVVLHEFGHLVGLNHVADPAQVMYHRPTPRPAGMAPGDLRGLAALGAGPCFRDF